VTVPDFDTVIVGAGFSGIGTAIKLDKSGLSDYLVMEAGDGPGGTWYWNTYPGIAVDIPSFSYQFSFEQSPNWTRSYARGRELKAYAEHCVDKYGLRRKIRFGTKVLGADFDERGIRTGMELCYRALAHDTTDMWERIAPCNGNGNGNGC